MTRRTVMIAGKELQVPVGCKYFTTEAEAHAFKIFDPDANADVLMFLDEFDCPMYSDWLPIVAAVARCWHLDRAEECVTHYGIPDSMGNQTIDEDAAKKKVRHLASAAKWARIGKGAKG